MGKFKIGDRVQITNLDRFRNDPGVDEEMFSFINKEAKICGIYPGEHKWYVINIDDGRWIWDDRWLKLLDSIDSKKISYPINWNDVISKGYGKI